MDLIVGIIIGLVAGGAVSRRSPPRAVDRADEERRARQARRPADARSIARCGRASALRPARGDPERATR